jgi:hypothetical protein
MTHQTKGRPVHQPASDSTSIGIPYYYLKRRKHCPHCGGMTAIDAAEKPSIVLTAGHALQEMTINDPISNVYHQEGW